MHSPLVLPSVLCTIFSWSEYSVYGILGTISYVIHTGFSQADTFSFRMEF
jgi:hypothetical protein